MLPDNLGSQFLLGFCFSFTYFDSASGCILERISFLHAEQNPVVVLGHTPTCSKDEQCQLLLPHATPQPYLPHAIHQPYLRRVCVSVAGYVISFTIENDSSGGLQHSLVIVTTNVTMPWDNRRANRDKFHGRQTQSELSRRR